MPKFPVRTPDQLEVWIRAKLPHTRPGFTGVVVVHTQREEYICAQTRRDCGLQAVLKWGDDPAHWHWFEVNAETDCK